MSKERKRLLNGSSTEGIRQPKRLRRQTSTGDLPAQNGEGQIHPPESSTNQINEKLGISAQGNKVTPAQGRSSIPPDEVEKDTLGTGATMLLQPETRPIAQDQLVNEVKGIYAGLVMVEKKCVEVCTAQTAKPLKDEQWQALIALHRTLLHEHHDFFLASQHPTASPALRRLATKYAMPARLVALSLLLTSLSTLQLRRNFRGWIEAAFEVLNPPWFGTRTGSDRSHLRISRKLHYTNNQMAVGTSLLPTGSTG